MKKLPEQQLSNGTLAHSSSVEHLKILEELDDEEGIPSIVPLDVTKGGSLNRRLVIPQSPFPQIGNKIGLKFGKNKRKCKFIFQNIWIVFFLHPFTNFESSILSTYILFFL